MSNALRDLIKASEANSRGIEANSRSVEGLIETIEKLTDITEKLMRRVIKLETWKRRCQETYSISQIRDD